MLDCLYKSRLILKQKKIFNFAYLRGIRHNKIGRPSNLLRMVGFNIWGVGVEGGGGAMGCWGRIGAGSVLTTGGGSSTFMTLTGTAFPPPVLPFPEFPETEVGAGLCPFLLFGVDFLTGKMREMAARFVAESSAGGCCEAVWPLER